MKVKYIGESDEVSLIKNKIYDCIGEEHGECRIIDEEGYDGDEAIQGYLYPKRFFAEVDDDTYMGENNLVFLDCGLPIEHTPNVNISAEVAKFREYCELLGKKPEQLTEENLQKYYEFSSIKKRKQSQ